MTADEREEERRFLAELKARSGRDLPEWMAAISAQGFADKNDTIDWLRAQGFPFARASWLERIHTNGGKPIYLHDPPKPAPMPPPEPERPRARALTPKETADLDKLVAAAKGYRPLYQLLESEIRRALPGVTIEPKPGYISIGRPREFAAITLHASELRLGLDLGERAFDAHLQRAKLRGPGRAISHMVVLTDARQVNADLLALLIGASARVNG
ncbi:MAG TPA: DUF5655 domain-containing protein [Hyphomicrobiaceae bacterium]|nr:DUF5655 domain-containing protein [Hyphomicrobiaceae bacterium]